MRTIRNPPEALLPAEVARGAVVANRMLAATPLLRVRLVATQDGDLTLVDAIVENLGFLPTAGSSYAEEKELVAPIRLDLILPDTIALVDGQPTQTVGHLDGWGSQQVGGARHGIYPSLGARGPRARARWVLRGEGALTVAWTAVRAGSGEVFIDLGSGWRVLLARSRPHRCPRQRWCLLSANFGSRLRVVHVRTTHSQAPHALR